MLIVHIPGRDRYEFRHLVLDLNGTLALDGQVAVGVQERLAQLGERLTIHLVTADTQGRGAEAAAQLGISLRRVEPGDEASQKATFVQELGASSVVAVGNGANDAAMLAQAALGIAVLGGEGLAVAALEQADVLVGHINEALGLLLHPRRLVATLRT
jgi:P-type E1-E2 ATPase